MPATMTTISALTKEMYEEPLRMQLNDDTMALSRVVKATGASANVETLVQLSQRESRTPLFLNPLVPPKSSIHKLPSFLDKMILSTPVANWGQKLLCFFFTPLNKARLVFQMRE